MGTTYNGVFADLLHGLVLGFSVIPRSAHDTSGRYGERWTHRRSYTGAVNCNQPVTGWLQLTAPA
jgi:hypothetical protein